MTGQQRAVLDASTFIKGWLIATTLWVGIILIVAPFVLGVPTVQGEMDVAHLWGAGLSLAFWAVAGLVGFSWHPGWLGLWAATVGAAAAVGRWSIRKDAHTSEAGVLHP